MFRDGIETFSFLAEFLRYNQTVQRETHRRSHMNIVTEHEIISKTSYELKEPE